MCAGYDKFVRGDGAWSDWNGEAPPSEGWSIGELELDADASPFDVIAADLRRHRRAIDLLDRIADGQFDLEGAQALIGFLERDFPLHLRDLAHGLFPALRARCRPEDDIEKAILRLAMEQDASRSAARGAVAALERAVQAETEDGLSAHARRRVRAFVEIARRHLAIELAVLLPIARVRLDAASTATLSRALRDHRKALGLKDG